MILLFHPDDSYFEAPVKSFIEKSSRKDEIFYLKDKKINLPLAYQAEHWIKHSLVTVDYVDCITQVLRKDIKVDTLYFYPQLKHDRQVHYMDVCPLVLNAIMARNCNLICNIIEGFKYFKVFTEDFSVEYVLPTDLNFYQKEVLLSLECAQTMCQNYPSNLCFV